MQTPGDPRARNHSFQAAWWICNPHLQTIVPAFRRIHAPVRQRATVHTPDGDFLDLDWGTGRYKEIVILLHGLTGSSRSSYILGLQNALMQAGFRTVALNFRGCSGRPNNRANAYHSGETGDLDHVYRCIRASEPDTPIAAVGFSLGGNVLLKWLGEKAEALDLFAAAAVSVPFELHKCADRMDKGFSRLYRNSLLNELNRYMSAKYCHLETIGLHDEARKIAAMGDLSVLRSFWDYDDRVIAPLYGFRDVHDYYAQCSSRRFLKAIRVPTLVLQSLDDPFLTPDVVPDRGELADPIELEISPRGGHVGFVSGSIPGKPRYWLEHKIPGFLLEGLRQLSAHRMTS
ncbi:MAG: hydrolase [Methylococcaceae bacterium]|nr:hydrolase [Methylococcaceae bacterium]